ncbi:MAG TPA: beta-ketoacyl-ACP synthase III [Acidimicrobiia bacterium]|nr:beta-ketoacyl-ACP synthase III [Acidimicrobiia bacterium]
MTAFLGYGGHVPERVMTNDDWAALVDTSDEWIVQRTGIHERRVAAEDESTATLAHRAAQRALDDAGLTATDLDEIIVATDTPEVRTPDTASFLQHLLGAAEVPAFDLGGSGCAGFVLGLDVARSRIAFRPKKILVVGVELITRMISWKERETCVLFGDGAGAVVLGPTGGDAELLAVASGTDGAMTGILTLDVGGTKHPFDPADPTGHDHLTMHGSEVFKQAVHRMSAATSDVLAEIGAGVGDVDLVIPHQANKRIIDAVARRLDIPLDRVFVNVDRFGNTGSASVPLALWEARKEGRTGPGSLVVLTAFGAGFHWSAAAIRFR